jgi:hypothetical protein
MALRPDAGLVFAVMRKAVRTQIPRSSVCHEEAVIQGWVEDREPYLRLSADLSLSAPLATQQEEGSLASLVTRSR